MSSGSTDPVGAFLSEVEAHLDGLPDPFDECRPGALPARLRGRLAEFRQKDVEITRTFVYERGAMLQENVSHAFTTVFDSKMRESHRREELCRFQRRDDWWGKLSPEDMKAFDKHCLAIGEPILLPLFPPTIPHCLRGPLARLALEYAAIARRYTSARNQTEHRGVVNRPRNHTVLQSLLIGLTHDEKEAKSRLAGRWFRELTTEQAVAFDSAALGLIPDEADDSSAFGPAATASKGKKKAPAKPGPKKPRNDPANDKRIHDEWEAARMVGHRKFADFERAKGYARGTVRPAVKRHKERLRNLQ